MPRARVSVLVLLALAGACSPEGGGPLAEAPTGPAEPSSLLLQAVDAGTGAALADNLLTVRHLVRYPITLDAAAVEEVPSAEAYRIGHPVAHDSLVLEVRLEASSYHRLDTVLTVARGASVGPVTLRMARRLERAGRPTQVAARPSPGGETGAASAAPGGAAPASDAEVDRGPLRAGDQAFQAGNWAQATAAYQRMTPPPQRTGAYARDYTQALVRRGTAHIRLGEWGGALDALEEAVTFDAPGHRAYLLLAQAQCAVGRVEAGRQTLTEIDRIQAAIPEAERPTAFALAVYQRGLCSQYEFSRAQEARDRIRTGSAAISELDAFVQRGEAIPSPSPELAAALADARRRVEDIRQRMRGG